MASHRKELTLDQLLDDPLIRAVMRADRVDPVRLRATLARQTASLGESQRALAAAAPSMARALASACAAAACRSGAGPW